MKNCIMIYTDGGARGNGKADSVSGWAYTLEYNGSIKFDKGSTIGATNNQMEMKAIIEALSAIRNKKLPVKLHSDSALCVNGINQWLAGWKKNNWRNSKKEIVENKELWVQIDQLVSQFSNLEVIKVKGHSDVEGNILVDALVNEAMDDLEEKQKTSDLPLQWPSLKDNNGSKLECLISELLWKEEEDKLVDKKVEQIINVVNEIAKLRKDFLKDMK